jgi:hypothetical protein
MIARGFSALRMAATAASICSLSAVLRWFMASIARRLLRKVGIRRSGREDSYAAGTNYRIVLPPQIHLALVA